MLRVELAHSNAWINLCYNSHRRHLLSIPLQTTKFQIFYSSYFSEHRHKVWSNCPSLMKKTELLYSLFRRI